MRGEEGFLPYNPEQAYLLPPSVQEMLGDNHLCFFLHRVVEELDLRGFEADYVEEGRAGMNCAGNWRRRGERPTEVSADSGFFSVRNLKGLEQRGIEGYLPDAHLTGELKRRRGRLKCARDSPEHVRMRARLRSPAGQARYRKRQALVEPVFGILKEQRGMRRFRLRGLEKVSVETALACMAFNLTRMWRMKNLPTPVH